QRLDTFAPDGGAWPPRADEVLLERTAFGVARATRGGALTVRLADGSDHALRVAGAAHAAGLAPAWMEHAVPGSLPWDSPLRAGESAQVRFAVRDHALDEGHIRDVADRVRAALEAGGRTVTRVDVPPPGRHPHADQMEAFLFLILAFGIL